MNEGNRNHKKTEPQFSLVRFGFFSGSMNRTFKHYWSLSLSSLSPSSWSSGPHPVVLCTPPLAGAGHAGHCHPPLPLPHVVPSLSAAVPPVLLSSPSSLSAVGGDVVLVVLSFRPLHCLPVVVIPIPLLPVSTPRAVARGCGWGCCCVGGCCSHCLCHHCHRCGVCGGGGCRCCSCPSPVPHRSVVVAVIPSSSLSQLASKKVC